MLFRTRLYILTTIIICVALSFDAFASESLVEVGDISIVKNKKTRVSTILRELEFDQGDVFEMSLINAKLSKAEENLMNTSLFNFVNINPSFNNDSTRLDIEINVIERWYIWPIPLLEIADRNFNQWWKDKDFSRLNYGVMLKWENFTGRRDMLKTIIRLGHEDKLGFFYEIPSFNRKKNFGFEAAISFSRHHEIGVASVNNKLEYYKDEEKYVHETFDIYSRLVYRPQIHQKQFVELKFENINIDEVLISEYPDFTSAGKQNLRFLSFAYKFISDHRDYKSYPLKGYYFDISFNKIGLGVIKPKTVDFLFLKSNINAYFNIKNRWYFGAGLLSKYSNSKVQPYVLQKGLGFKQDFIRGYELYVMDGQKYALFRSNLKFELIPKKVYNIKFIKNEKFSKLFYSLYANLFFDLAYVDDAYNAQLNPLVNEFQHSLGIGIDFVTYYDLVFRMEFSRNGLNEHAVFFHVKAPF